MYEIVSAKFQQNIRLKERLIGTGNKTLIECNPDDHYWGIGLSLQREEIWQQAKWKGEHRLREILKRVGGEIK